MAAHDSRAVYLRHVALRCLRNGRGDAAVAKLFERHLAVMCKPSTLASDAGDDLALEKTLSADVIDARCASLNSDLRALLWPGAEVVISYDEVHSLFGTPKIFLGLTKYRSAVSAATAASAGAVASASYGERADGVA